MAAKKAEIKKIKYNETHRFMYSRVHIQSRRKTTMLMSNDIGIDLGTASILVYIKGHQHSCFPPALNMHS